MLIREESEFREKSEAFLGSLLKLKPADHHMFFDGDTLGLIDVAIAPLFTRLRYMTSTMAALHELSKKSSDAARLLKWITHLQEHPAVIGALPDGFDQDIMYATLHKWVASLCSAQRDTSHMASGFPAPS